ncbi:MAG: hypothetical protein Q8L55_07310 [Phycisphaerales bacterium]|nr:hypothetical protein [Phycisphaerales bacterium]
MKFKVRAASQFLDNVRRDLTRPHAFAFERVGFVYAREAVVDGGPSLLLPFAYAPVADAHYMPKEGVGACISGDAIREAMAFILREDACVLHTHMHENVGMPKFSRVDVRNYPGVVRAFQNTRPDRPHGALLLSRDAAVARVWPVGAAEPVMDSLVISVGRPMGIFSEGAIYG